MMSAAAGVMPMPVKVAPHSLKLRVGAALMVDQLVCKDGRLVQAGYQVMIVSLGGERIVDVLAEQLFADRFNGHCASDLAGERAAHTVGHGHDDAVVIDLKTLRLDDKFAILLRAGPGLGVGDVEQKVIVLIALSDAAYMRGGMYLNSEHN